MSSEQKVGFLEVSDVIELAQRIASQSKSCFSCLNCNIEENVCTKFGSTPPMRIIKVGCPQYEIDIPF